MKRPLVLLLAGVACLGLAGPNAWGRLALWAGLPGAAAVLSDPAARGLAYYRSGDFEAADATLAQAGRGQTFNRALTLAATGRHALSVAYLDAVIFANPADAEAHHVRALVDQMVPKVIGESVAPGRLAAVGGLVGSDPAGPSAARPTPNGRSPSRRAASWRQRPGWRRSRTTPANSCGSAWKRNTSGGQVSASSARRRATDGDPHSDDPVRRLPGLGWWGPRGQPAPDPAGHAPGRGEMIPVTVRGSTPARSRWRSSSSPIRMPTTGSRSPATSGATRASAAARSKFSSVGSRCSRASPDSSPSVR